MSIERNEIIIIGAGITGLSAATVLKENATIIEQSNQPGGLVRSHCFDGGYWFDHVLHIFHCNNQDTLNIIKHLVGPILKKCPPIAWIETKEGIVRYPFQLNIGSLNYEAKINCINDFAKASYAKSKNEPIDSYKTFLTNTFGETMCELFYYPYNEKQWKYPLNEIATTGQLWNLHQPTLKEILQGAFEPDKFRATYNTNAFYPQPDKNAEWRGMELLTRGLAKEVKDLRLNTKVLEIDPKEKTLLIDDAGSQKRIGYNRNCFSTIPMPALMKICNGVPQKLLNEVDQLKWNKVLSIAISIKGVRPVSPGHWRYYTDPDMPFTRLIFMTEFDTFNAPSNGWGLLAELTLASNDYSLNIEKLKSDTINSLRKNNIIDETQKIIGIHSWIIDPAYVIFTPETERITNDCFDFLEKNGITTSGRYGKWEYSSMSKNIEDGFNYGKMFLNE